VALRSGHDRTPKIDRREWTWAMTHADNGGDNLEDEDIDAPAVEELKMLATLLWDANQRKRLKEKKGKRFVNYLKSGLKSPMNHFLPLKEYVWAIAYGL
jgi:hypothetical protein